jgi:hypothetical protein
MGLNRFGVRECGRRNNKVHFCDRDHIAGCAAGLVFPGVDGNRMCGSQVRRSS